MTDYGELPPELGRLPGAFSETTEESIESSMVLLEKWHRKGNNRIQYLFAPRGILSSSEQMLLEVKKLADQYGTGVHIHACENRTEMQRVIEQRGANEIQYLDGLGLSGPNLMLAHCVWANEEDIRVLARTGTHVLHCPSANLKLASGIAPIPAMIRQGVNVSVGADGAPCNNNLDAFVEMRMAALIQKGHLLDPTVMPAKQVFEMATINGARALGMEAEIGSIEVGKKADLVILDLFKPHSIPYADLYAAIVYSCGRENVETVMVDGEILLDQGYFLKVDPEETLRKCQSESRRLLARMAGEGAYREDIRRILEAIGPVPMEQSAGDGISRTFALGVVENLSERELEVLRLIARGATNQEIAEELVITVGTVKSHINHILRKLEAHNRTEAVARARQLDLVKI